MDKINGSEWQHIVINGKDFIIKSIYGSECTVMISDLTYLWYKNCTESDLVALCKELNPVLECEGNILAHKAFGFLNEPQKANLELCINEAGRYMLLKLENSIEGMPFKFHLKLDQQGAQEFHREVTKSLLAVCKELLARQEALCKLLIKKDVEIAEYKMEGATISRRNVETKEFDQNEFVERRLSLATDLHSIKEILTMFKVVNDKRAEEETPLETTKEKEEENIKEEKINEYIKEELTQSTVVKKEGTKKIKRVKLNL